MLKNRFSIEISIKIIRIIGIIALIIIIIIVRLIIIKRLNLVIISITFKRFRIT